LLGDVDLVVFSEDGMAQYVEGLRSVIRVKGETLLQEAEELLAVPPILQELESEELREFSLLALAIALVQIHPAGLIFFALEAALVGVCGVLFCLLLHFFSSEFIFQVDERRPFRFEY